MPVSPPEAGRPAFKDLFPLIINQMLGHILFYAVLVLNLKGLCISHRRLRNAFFMLFSACYQPNAAARLHFNSGKSALSVLSIIAFFRRRTDKPFHLPQTDNTPDKNAPELLEEKTPRLIWISCQGVLRKMICLCHNIRTKKDESRSKTYIPPIIIGTTEPICYNNFIISYFALHTA